PIPDEAPELGIFRNIYTVFPKPEQLKPGYGYFAILVKEITDLIKKAGPGDLVILDEVPTGTDYQELVAVAVVLIEDLIKSGATVIVTGHLKKAFQLLAERTGQQPYMHTVKDVEGHMVPDFGLEPGVAKHSYAIELMREAGFPKQIIELARSYYRVITEGLGDSEIPNLTHLEKPKSAEPIGKNPAFSALETVIENLYPENSFAFPSNQDVIINTVANMLVMPNRMKHVNQRLRITECFVAKGIAYLGQLTRLLSEFEKISPRRHWGRLNYDPAENIRQIDLLKEKIQPLMDVLQEIPEEIQTALIGYDLLKEESEAGGITGFLKKTLTRLDELRQENAAVDVTTLTPEEWASKALEWQTLKWEPLFKELINNLMVLDEYTGIARGIIRYNLKSPRFSKKPNTFVLKDSRPFFPSWASRNPFLAVDNPIPNSLEINPDRPVFVLTGPNTSGKSVLMFNSFANATFALSGFYVSGDLEISAFDNVYAFFGGRNVTESGKSYFLDILSQYAEIIRRVTPNSLLILDEMHGTDNF
ncbi:MAG: hypothetical protein FJZ16_10355, partial [Candidatus Omnitrophica bacterium]|nr:hypothetical protein [Candidatus Omnitrophota bacterium]